MNGVPTARHTDEAFNARKREGAISENSAAHEHGERAVRLELPVVARQRAVHAARQGGVATVVASDGSRDAETGVAPPRQ